jgi:general secretion pathway protein L
MKLTFDIKRTARTFLTIVNKCVRLGGLLGNVLTGNCLEGLFYPKRCTCVSVEKDGFCVVRVSRFLSRIRVRPLHEYTAENDKPLTADTFASLLSLALNASKPGKRSKITLVMPKDWVIARTTDMPLAVKENLANVVAYELDRITPLAANEAYYDFRIVREDDQKVQLFVLACQADRLHSYLAALKAHHITVERVTTEFSGLRLLEEEHVKRKCRIADDMGLTMRKAVGGGMESILPKVNATDLLTKGTKAAQRRPVAVTVILVAVSIGLIIPCIIAPLLHETKRVKEIERQIAMRKEGVSKVEELKKEIDSVAKDVTAIEDFKEKRPMLLAILKEVTTVLPKNVWLTHARVTDTGVELEGYAASASSLLSILEQSKYLKKVEFAMPTTRDQRLKADRFLLKMELEGFDATRPTGGGNNEEKKK